MENFKVAIIGGGPGGYETAIRLNQYNISTVVFEKADLGGVCLNWGCIPTKTMVKSADLFHEMKNAKQYGLNAENLSVDYSKIYNRKNKVVKQLTSGVNFLFKKRNIPIIAEEVNKIEKCDNSYHVHFDDSKVTAEYIIIATGSQPKDLPSLKIDKENVLSSRDILAIKEQPKEMVIVGGGVIGVEFASIFAQLGTKIHLVEFLPNLVSTEDEEISKRLTMALKKAKIKVHLKTAVESYEKKEDKLIVKLSNGKEITTDKILLSVGRKPLCDINFVNCDLEKENDFIKISSQMKTNLDKVFAIGDITGKLMLAHTASKQGFIVADMLDNEINNSNREIKEIDYKKIPACIFSNPEIGSVGFTEKEAKEKFDEIKVGKFPFSANGKSLGLGNRFGFTKIIMNAENHKLIGMHIIGPEATELIAQGGILIGSEATLQDIKDVVFAHPTLSEVIFEALEDLEDIAIHKV